MTLKYPKAGPGPWDSEPDSLVFEAHGLPCYLHRGSSGAWCGYVGVPESHPLAKLRYSEESPALVAKCEERMKQPVGEHQSMAVSIACLTDKFKASADFVLNVHGGITYANDAPGGKKHDARAPWWFGFDTSHCDDFAPGLVYGTVQFRTTYRDLAYVKAECESLAKQLAEL